MKEIINVFTRCAFLPLQINAILSKKRKDSNEWTLHKISRFYPELIKKLISADWSLLIVFFIINDSFYVTKNICVQ